VFLSLEWDIGLHYSNAESLLDGSSHIEKLVQWGRPLWSAFYHGQRSNPVQALVSEKMDMVDLGRCVLYAAKKLLPAKQDYSNQEQLDLSAFAVLAIRLHLDLDFIFPTRASKLVSSKMRRLIDVDPCRKHIVTTYGSSPFLDPHLSKPRVDRSPSQSPFGNKISTVPQTNDSLYHAGKYGYLNQMLGGEGHVPLDS